MSLCQFDSEAIDFRVASECFAWQFYDTYQGNEKVATLLRQLPWSSNRQVLAKCKRPEERGSGLPAGESIGNLSTERCNLSTGEGRIRKAIVNPSPIIVSRESTRARKSLITVETFSLSGTPDACCRAFRADFL
ncbi:MAG: hypothetical protein HY853_05980 [Burkholderiales bacterium]|nr:hypothetical protein [Burkholderiales bacterium]